MTTPTQRTLQPRMADQTGIRFGLANGALVLALLVAAALPLNLGETALVALLAAAAGSAALPALFAGALGLEAWAFFTGFFENRYGALTLAAPDLLRLGGFVLATAVLAHLIRMPLELSEGRADE